MQHALLFVQQQTYCVVHQHQHQIDEPSAVVIICLKNEFLAVRFCISSRTKVKFDLAFSFILISRSSADGQRAYEFISFI